MTQGGGSKEPTTHDMKEPAGVAPAAAETAWTDAPGDASPQPAATAAELEAKLAELEGQIAQLKEERLRALAEVENVRRRAARDRQDASQYAISGFARDLLSVADNLQRALATVDATARANDPALDVLMNGVELTERELLAVLERNGVKAFEAEGLPFDPHVHEAMFEIPNEAMPHGTVLQVLQRGYLLHERTLRPARVGISRGGPKLQPGVVPPAAEATPAAAATETDAVAIEPAEPAQPATEASPAEPAAPSEAGSATAEGSAAEKIIDFLKRATHDAYPKQSGSDPRTGSRIDEKL